MEKEKEIGNRIDILIDRYVDSVCEKKIAGPTAAARHRNTNQRNTNFNG